MRKPESESSLRVGAQLSVQEALGMKLQETSLVYLVRLIAEVLDASAEGENVFVTIGANRAKTAFVLTVTWDGTKMYAPGLTLLAIGEACMSLLEDA